MLLNELGRLGEPHMKTGDKQKNIPNHSSHRTCVLFVSPFFAWPDIVKPAGIKRPAETAA